MLSYLYERQWIAKGVVEDYVPPQYGFIIIQGVANRRTDNCL
jgi:hypothetical protein